MSSGSRFPAAERRLWVTSGPLAGTAVEVERELIIGREAADVTISDEQVSRRHAAVRPVESGVVVEDLDSLNGTFVDGERIHGLVTVTVDATIRVGRSEIRLTLRTPSPASEPPAQVAYGGDATRFVSTLPAQPAEPEPEPPPEPPLEPEPPPEPEPAPEPPVVQPAEPTPVAQPELTRVRAIPVAPLPPSAVESTPASGEPIAQPELTRVRRIPRAQEPPPELVPTVQPELARVPPIPGAQEPPVSPPAAGEPSSPEAIVQPQVTRVRAVLPGGEYRPVGGLARPPAMGSLGDSGQANPPRKGGLLSRVFRWRRGAKRSKD
jgi:predicted component of type VI protein secretion system